jgi:hypothetical protein
MGEKAPKNGYGGDLNHSIYTRGPLGIKQDFQKGVETNAKQGS